MSKISSKIIKSADLRYYVDGMGIEMSDSLSKVVLVDFGNGRYINPFCISDDYPIFKRSHVSNLTEDGHAFGLKVYHVSNSLVTGPCWVLDNNDFSECIGKDEISFEDLENYILSSDDFYKDRFKIAEKRLFSGKRPFRMRKIIKQDEISLATMENFFNSRESGIQKVKED